MKNQSKKTNNNQKAPYISPELQVYGTISELTHSGGSVQLDGVSSSQNAFDSLPPQK